MVFTQSGYCNFAFNAAALLDQVTQHDAAHLFRNAIGANALQEAFGVLALHIKLGKCREIHEARCFAHRLAFFRHHIKPVGTAEGVVLAVAVS